jgi:hypothetical protein
MSNGSVSLDNIQLQSQYGENINNNKIYSELEMRANLLKILGFD